MAMGYTLQNVRRFQSHGTTLLLYRNCVGNVTATKRYILSGVPFFVFLSATVKSPKICNVNPCPCGEHKETKNNFLCVLVGVGAVGGVVVGGRTVVAGDRQTFT